VSARTTSYLEAVRAGLYTPLGAGDLDIAAIVTALENAGYSGWYVLEQDCALYGEPDPGAGPVLDVRRSVELLTSISALT
jgi:inosose dehydratase